MNIAPIYTKCYSFTVSIEIDQVRIYYQTADLLLQIYSDYNFENGTDTDNEQYIVYEERR